MAQNASEGVEIISSVQARRIFVDNSGNVYVSSGNDVYKYTLSGSYTKALLQEVMEAEVI